MSRASPLVIRWHICVLPMLFDRAYCNALLLALWSVGQKPDHVSSVELCHRVCAFNQFSLFTCTHLCDPQPFVLHLGNGQKLRMGNCLRTILSRKISSYSIWYRCCRYILGRHSCKMETTFYTFDYTNVTSDLSTSRYLYNIL